MAWFPQEGSRDLIRRMRIAGLWSVRVRVRRALSEAEAELGWLGWEQVDFFDNPIGEEVRKVQEFENKQASLLNVSAELSGRRAALDDELARERALQKQAEASLTQERAPIAAQLEEEEAARRQKLEAGERFDRALEEIDLLEKRLEARSRALMNVGHPPPEIRIEALEISDHLGNLPEQRKLILADKTTAIQQAALFEPGIAHLRSELRRIDDAASEARDRLAEVTRRLTAQMRQLEREKKKSNVHISRLDREKQRPYRLIGGCLADHRIAPLNQPHVLEKVLALRERDAQLARTMADLQAACTAANAVALTAFYLLLAIMLFFLFAGAHRFIH